MYNPDDPYGLLSGPFGQQQRRQGTTSLPALSQPEEDSLLSSVGGKVLGGIGWVGDLLDKYTGGRAARGLLAGKTRELASIIPFSDQLHLTDESQKVTGRELSDQWGWSDHGSDSMWDTLKGVGADVLTNPSTYLTFGAGAATEAGQAAAKIGALPTTALGRIKGLSALEPAQAARAADLGMNAADITGKSLGGLVGVGLPFSKPSFVLGTGSGGEAVLGGLSKLGELAQHIPGVKPLTDNVLEPAGRHLQALFNHKVAGATSVEGQQSGRAFTDLATQGLNENRGLEGQLLRLAQEHNLLDDAGGSLLRQVAEAPIGSASPLTPQGKAANQIADLARGHLDKLDQAVPGFAPHKLLDSEIDYFPRFEAPLEQPTRGYSSGGPSSRPLTQPAALEGREEILRNIPGGTEALNRASLDPEVAGIAGRFGPSPALGPHGPQQPPLNELQRAKLVRERYLGMGPQEEADAVQALALRSQGTPLSPYQETMVAKWEQSHKLSDWLARNVDPRRLEEGKAVFGNHPLQDWARAANARVQRNAAGEAGMDLFGRVARPAIEAGPHWQPVNKALERAGFDDINMARQSLMGKLGGANPNDLYVPPTAVNDAVLFKQGLQVPPALRPLLDGVDWLTDLTKTMQTSPWPGFHARNFVSGGFANLANGAQDPLSLLPSIGQAHKLLGGQTIEDASQIPYMMNALARKLGRAPTDAEATAEIANLAYQYRAVSSGVHQGGDVAAELASKLPGMRPFEGYGQALQGAIPRSLEEANPLNVAGVNRTVDQFAPVKAGRAIGTQVEDTNRLSGFLGYLQQGYHPEEAANLTRGAHVDYAALAPFEKEVMRRLMPFYTYSRGTIPNVLGQLAEKPGGLSGQWAMAANEMRQGDHQLLPEYLGGGLAVPLGKEDNGTQRFLTRIDTQPESAFENIRPTLAGTGMSLLGQLSPLLKAPLETATGKQFFTGRDLADLYPATGNTILDQLLYNSPVSRAAGSVRTLLDERKDLGTKALNLGTGIKVSDVDVEKARDIQARQIIADTLRGQQGVGRSESFYLRPNPDVQPTPEEIALLRLQKSIEERSKRRVGVRQ